MSPSFFSRFTDDDSDVLPRDQNEGFTLVELLVVLVIMGLVMSIVGPRVLNYLTSSRERTTRLQISSFQSALDLFYLDSGRYPSASEGLEALIKRPSSNDSWNGPYLQQSAVPTDPWGNPYRYKLPGSGEAPYQIISLGSDGRDGGQDDAADIANK